MFNLLFQRDGHDHLLEVKATTAALTAGNRRVIESKVVDSAYINGAVVDYVSPEKGNISMNVGNQPVFAVFQSLAEQTRYSASVTSDVNPTKPISRWTCAM